MSKLETIKKALSNPYIVIINSSKTAFPPERGIINVIYYFVAPKSGLYTIDELRAFMTNLVPDLKPSYKQDFEQCKNSLRLGEMYFDEKIGEKTTSITEILSSAPEEKENVDWLVPGKKSRETTEEYDRRIWVTLAPSKAIGFDFLANKFNSGSWIKLEDIAKYRDAEAAEKQAKSEA